MQRITLEKINNDKLPVRDVRCLVFTSSKCDSWPTNLFVMRDAMRCRIGNVSSTVRFVFQLLYDHLSLMQYMKPCVFSLPVSIVIIVGIYVLYLIIITKLELWIISQCLRLGHGTMVWAVCLVVFLPYRGAYKLGHLANIATGYTWLTAEQYLMNPVNYGMLELSH